MDRRLSVLVLLIFISCEKNSPKEITLAASDISDYQAIYSDSLNLSTVQVPLDYPIRDLQKMINRLMPDTLMSDTIPLKKKSDYVLVKITPIGKLLLNGYQNKLDASLPLSAQLFFRKKVGGITIANKKSVDVRLRVDLRTVLSLDEDFHLNTRCSLQKIHWIDEPTIKVAGVKVNLKKKIAKQIDKNKGVMADAICTAINKSVPVRKEVLALWNLLNTTHRVTKKPVEIWLSMVPNQFSAVFDHEITDTLRINVQTQTGILLTPLKGVTVAGSNLPKNKIKRSMKGLNLKVSLNVPYQYLDLIISDQLDSQVVEYAGLSATLTDFKTSAVDNQLSLQFQTKGDVDVNIQTTTSPSLSADKTLIFDNLKYSMDSENVLINSLDWVSNSSINEYILDYTQVPLAHILDSLDTKIVRSLDRKELSSKIELDLSFSNIDSDTVIYYRDRFEWLFSVAGTAHAYLSDSLVVK
ncbi:MAG: DUF4403 family protein [Bacteroidota bacterium]